MTKILDSSFFSSGEPYFFGEDGSNAYYNENWKVMNDLETSFSEITTFNFMLEQLQDAVDNGRTNEIVDITHALNAFMPVYTNNWDKKFKVAWEHIVK